MNQSLADQCQGARNRTKPQSKMDIGTFLFIFVFRTRSSSEVFRFTLSDQPSEVKKSKLKESCFYLRAPFFPGVFKFNTPHARLWWTPKSTSAVTLSNKFWME